MFYTEPALAYRETVLSRQLLILLISSLEWYIAEKIFYLLLEMENFEQSITCTHLAAQVFCGTTKCTGCH
jgi:hypothetical protein